MSDRHLDRHARIVAAYHVGPMQSHETIVAILEGHSSGRIINLPTKGDPEVLHEALESMQAVTTRRGKSW